MIKIKDIVSMLHEHDIVFSYSGLISQNILVSLAGVAKKDLLSFEDEENRVNRIYEVTIEMFHNILSYSKDKIEVSSNVFESKGACIISRNCAEDRYCVVGVNEIEKEAIESVKEKIDCINSLSKVQRREFLKEQLSKKTKPSAKGAGLGFFEMSRRSKEPLEYEFFTISDRDYFAIKVII